jgi:pyroglutamyl-peptidase
MLTTLLGQGIRAEVSQTAGTFVCNHVFYGLMHELESDAAFDGVKGGLIHVPWLPEQGQPSMTLPQIVDGLAACIECALHTEHDIKRQAGALN